jgi:hypothetical protein
VLFHNLVQQLHAPLPSARTKNEDAASERLNESADSLQRDDGQVLTTAVTVDLQGQSYTKGGGRRCWDKGQGPFQEGREGGWHAKQWFLTFLPAHHGPLLRPRTLSMWFDEVRMKRFG